MLVVGLVRRGVEQVAVAFDGKTPKSPAPDRGEDSSARPLRERACARNGLRPTIAPARRLPESVSTTARGVQVYMSSPPVAQFLTRG